MAAREYNLAWPVHALAAVQEFHFLREKQQRSGSLAIDEARHVMKLRDIFEPMRTVGRGLRRQPVKVRVKWTAVLIGPRDERQEAEVVGLSLRELEVALRHSLPIGTEVRLIIAGPGPREWVRFAGRTAALTSGSNRTAIRIRSAKSWTDEDFIRRIS